MATFNGNAGRVAMNPRGPWDPEEDYSRLDLVTYEGQTYIAKEANTNTEPTDELKWMNLVMGGNESEPEESPSIRNHLMIFVDQLYGNDENSGNRSEPIATLTRACELMEEFPSKDVEIQIIGSYDASENENENGYVWIGGPIFYTVDGPQIIVVESLDIGQGDTSDYPGNVYPDEDFVFHGTLAVGDCKNASVRNIIFSNTYNDGWSFKSQGIEKLHVDGCTFNSTLAISVQYTNEAFIEESSFNKITDPDFEYYEGDATIQNQDSHLMIRNCTFDIDNGMVCEWGNNDDTPDQSYCRVYSCEVTSSNGYLFYATNGGIIYEFGNTLTSYENLEYSDFGGLIYHDSQISEIMLPNVPVSKGGTGKTEMASTNYAATEYRGMSLNSTDTNATISGTISWTYQ